MKNNKRYFKSNIYNHLGLYVLGIIIVPIIVLTVCYYKTRVQEYEKFSLFITSDKVEGQLLHNELEEVLKEYSLLEDYQYVHSIVNENETTYLSNFEQYGVSLSDFLIIPERYTTEDFLGRYMNPFKDYYEDGISYGDPNPVTYAIRVFNKDTKQGYMTDYMNYELKDENYYLCISKNSYHYSNYINNNDSLLKTYINWMLSK